MKLPGQIKPASDLLLAAIQDVQEQIGRPIEFCDITTHPIQSVRHSRGHHDWDNTRERIWLNPNLSYDDQEAVAAHELAHVLQKADGYCQTATKRDKKGRPIIPELNLLGRTINGLITDTMADRWAAQRGFKIEEGLKADALPKALNDAKNKRPGELEYVDWDSCYFTLKNLAQMFESGEQIIAVTLPPEVKTQIRAVFYANLKLRLSPFGLFSELDSVWAENLPKARDLGIEITALVENIGTDNREQCKRATISIIQHLNIPPPLLIVKRPDTEEIAWPE